MPVGQSFERAAGGPRGGAGCPGRHPPRPGCLQARQLPRTAKQRCSSNQRTTEKMWPFWGLDLNRVRCDLVFTEAINQRMQVPNRLKVADSFSAADKESVTEDVPPSFRMHIPDRISLEEISDASLRPILLSQQKKVPCVMVHVSPDSSAQPTCLGELPLLHGASRSSSQKRKRSGHHSSRSQRERTSSDCAQLALHSPGQHHERSQEAGPAPESALEEVGVAEMAAMRKQLMRISGRLRVLEEQCNAWRQKETLVYSMLISACLINTWLWLRR
ncbi:LOW QUALITY PROTEIN: mitochondrial fission factor homolog B-like [Nyctibius grandis]|uniref:LOW QUALITY PROTEIN: mitochondrial fission factor homolog B-like n=1 Tax=Nyctibius grandis TaxID=48427 RepID=UPI0035BC3DF2